ncbi:MAG: hypothetical protein ABJC63_11325 [Gemmatimonadales bacterium]
MISVCHLQGSVGTVTDIFVSQLAEHKSHGDYLARLEVTPSSTPGDSVHFIRITDALAAARAGRIARGETDKAACRITIAAPAGTFKGSTAPSADPTFERFPLVIDVPDITLQGALKMQVDAAGRATGVSEGGAVTTLAPSPALNVTNGGTQTGVSEPLVIVTGKPSGPKGNGAVIEGFVLQSGRGPDVTPVGGQGIFGLRAIDLVIRGNRFEGGFTETMDLRASSALVERNHLSGLGGSCDICLAGPGDYVARGNRILGPGGIPGITVTPPVVFPVPETVEQYTLPTTALTTAALLNNEVVGHVQKPVGVGLRVEGIGNGAPDVAGPTEVTMTGNNLVGNTWGIIVHAAFPVAGTKLRGDISLTTSGNTISKSCQNDLLVTLARHVTSLGISQLTRPYSVNSTYKLNLGPDVQWDKAWYAHPAGYGNTLLLNGEPLANGAFNAYNATKVCP